MAIVGVGIVLIYVKGANQRAIAGQQAVSVLVATQQVPAGTTAATALSEGLIGTQRLPARSVPTDALQSVTGLRNLVFSSTLPAGQLVLRPVLVTAVQGATTLPIPAGKVALTVQMCVQKAVAGYIQAGSQIAIFNTFYKAPPGSVTSSCAGTSFSKGATSIHARLVLNDVQVLASGAPGSASAAGQATATGAFSQSNNPSATETTVMVTVALDQQDAERLIELAESGLMYMALMTSSSHTTPDFTFKP